VKYFRVFGVRIGRPQLFAGLLLLLFAVQGFWLIQNRPSEQHDFSSVACGRSLWHLYDQGSCERSDSALASRAAASPFLFVHSIEGMRTADLPEYDLFRFASWVPTTTRLPMLAFGLWLGSGLWWVARRLFGTGGGLVALGLYCTSPFILNAASQISPEIIAAWGFFGAVYTAIGIGHTLLAPVHEWRYRILLLGAALGFTAAAVPAAALVALLFCVFFMIYLAPESRPRAAVALGCAVIFAFMVALPTVGFRLPLLFSGAPVFSAHWILRLFSHGSSIPLYAMAAIALAVFLGWRRARYFGNWSPLLVALITPFIAVSWSSIEPLVWALPFLFVFIGGLFADLFETKLRAPAVIAAVLLICAHAYLGGEQLVRSIELLRNVGMR
jgi:hypothetical protein